MWLIESNLHWTCYLLELEHEFNSLGIPHKSTQGDPILAIDPTQYQPYLQSTRPKINFSVVKKSIHNQVYFSKI